MRQRLSEHWVLAESSCPFGHVAALRGLGALQLLSLNVGRVSSPGGRTELHLTLNLELTPEPHLICI